MEKFGTDIGIGVTGSFANPDPDNADSVPGTVFYALNFRGTELAHRIGVHTGARHDSKTEVAEHIARELLAVLEQNGINRKGGGDR